MGVGMTPGEGYRLKAAELSGKAKNEQDILLRVELEQLALSYLRLAKQADKNIGDVYERPLNGLPPEDERAPRDPQQQQPQQQRNAGGNENG